MKSNTNGGFKVIWFAIFLAIIATFATQVNAGEKIEIEGTIQGIKCTHYKVECVNKDQFIAMETDFVLVVPSGEYYFIPNISRTVKVRHAYKKVLVKGERTGQEIWADNIVDLDKVKKGGKTKSTWDWTRHDEFWESR